MARALCEWRAVDVSSLAIGWVSVVMWQRVVQHCRRKPAGERQRASRRTQRGSLTLATLAVWCRSWLILSPTWRRWEAFCGNGQPATASGVAIFVCISPSGHVADAQVGEIPGYARLPPPPGWRKCPPLVIVSASAEVGRTLRCAYGVSLNRVSVRELSGRIAHIQPSLSALHPSVLACIDACASESSV